MAKAAEKLTKKRLDQLRAEVEADRGLTAFVADAGQPGLYVQARRGRVRFVFEYLPPAGGRRRQMQIDDYGAITLEAARSAALEHRMQVAHGIDPQDVREEKRRLGMTVADLADGYLEDLAERARTRARRGKPGGYDTAKRLLELHVLPALGDERARDLSSEQVRRLHRSMHGTPVAANRMLGALSAVYGWADRAELVPPGVNPTRYVERYAEMGIRRAFTGDELGALGQALREAEADGSVNPAAVLAMRFFALTGFRRSEVLGHETTARVDGRQGLRWGDVDLRSGLVHLHDTKTGRQTRAIGDAAVELLREAKPEGAEPADAVCPGRLRERPYGGIDRARVKLWALAGIEGVDVHSLRHTFASVGAHVDGGRYAGHVSALLGHGYQSRAITERYINANPQALRPAATAIAAEVERLMGEGEEGDAR